MIEVHPDELVELKDEIKRLRADLDLRNQTALDRKDAIAKLEAEIKRLRAQVTTKSGYEFVSSIDELSAAMTQQRRENEQLRAALESLTKDPPRSLAREPDEDWEVIVKMRAIAREALGE